MGDIFSYWSTREYSLSEAPPGSFPFSVSAFPLQAEGPALHSCLGQGWGRVRDGRNAHQPCLLPLGLAPAVLATLLASCRLDLPKLPGASDVGSLPPGSPLLFLFLPWEDPLSLALPRPGPPLSRRGLSLCWMFFWPCHPAFGSLVSDQGLNPCLLCQKLRVLSARLPGKSLLGVE